MIARIARWLKRRRARKCSKGLHVWTQRECSKHDRTIITSCKHCGVSYRTSW